MRAITSVSLSSLSPSSGFISFEPSALLLDDDDDEGSRVLGIVEEAKSKWSMIEQCKRLINKFIRIKN